MPAEPVTSGEERTLPPPVAMSESFLQQGYDHLYAGMPDAAAAAFRAACASSPELGETWGALADALSASGTPAIAAVAYGRAVTLDPLSWPLRLGQAETLWASGRADEAAAAFRLLTEERPDSGSARLGLARALAAGGHAALATEEYREALVLRPGHLETALELAVLLIDGRDALAAVELLQPLARRHPEEAALHHHIGRAWIVLCERDKALSALGRALELDEADRLGSGPLMAAARAEGAAGLSSDYVRALFDRYAEDFERHLTGKLGYAMPARLRDVIDDLPGPKAGLRVLDLGCGTGLGGAAFRSLAAYLAGVDLSPRMLAKARARQLYDDLQVGDIVAAMEATPDSWDLLVAADVLIYLGDLAPVFSAAAAALRPGGRFAGTVESSDGADFVLGPARRYAHSDSYIRRAAAEAGLRIPCLSEASPRLEKGVPLPGLLFVLEKPTS